MRSNDFTIAAWCAAGLFVLVALVAYAAGCWGAPVAYRGTHWSRPINTVATYEGLEGHRTACGVRINYTTRGTASPWRCGTKVRIGYRGHWVVATTLDHGPLNYPYYSLDLWGATARALGFRSGYAFGKRVVELQVKR